jgi:molybdopterin molybdotransferase
MLSVDLALQLVLDNTQPLPPVQSSLVDAGGRVLAEPIVSDIDSPPHDKAIVDGYAVVAADLVAPNVELAILEEITAGAMPTRTVERGLASRIMTGAPLPPGADAVVMVEQTEMAGNCVRILSGRAKSGQNIMRRAAAMSRGQIVLAAGKRLRPIELGLLAEVGRTSVLVIPQPRVTVIATGNELVEQGAEPAPGQIRNSNGPMLAALARSAGAVVASSEIARDNPDDLHRIISAGLRSYVLVISGGVSAGVLDLVPNVLKQLGVEQVFHKVDLKPGKPLWFGVRRRDESQSTLVFGLPGNPVSSLVCYELFVRPAIQKLCGQSPTGLRRAAGVLARDHQQRGERPTYWPAVWNNPEGETTVVLLPWQGSGDLRTLADANCLACFPAGERLYSAGERIDVLLFDE